MPVGGVHAEAGLFTRNRAGVSCQFQIADVSLLCFTFTGRIVIAVLQYNIVDLTK